MTDHKNSLSTRPITARPAIGLALSDRCILGVGLGETHEEMVETFAALREHGVQVLTVGQYLRPSERHLPVVRYWHPDEFKALEQSAYELGFGRVAAGPLVRSSYHADEHVPRADSPAPGRSPRGHSASSTSAYAEDAVVAADAVSSGARSPGGPSLDVPAQRQHPARALSVVTVALIAINVIAYLLEIRHGGSFFGGPSESVAVHYGAIPSSSPTRASTATLCPCDCPKAAGSAHRLPGAGRA